MTAVRAMFGVELTSLTTGVVMFAAAVVRAWPW